MQILKTHDYFKLDIRCIPLLYTAYINFKLIGQIELHKIISILKQNFNLMVRFIHLGMLIFIIKVLESPSSYMMFKKLILYSNSSFKGSMAIFEAFGCLRL